MATTYTTKADMITHFGDENVASWFDHLATTSCTTAENTYIDLAINQAEQLIDGKLSFVTTTPFTGAALTAFAATLKFWANTIAAFFIYIRPGLRETQGGGQLKAGYEVVVGLIDEYAQGNMKFPTEVSASDLIAYGHQGTESTTAADYTDKAFRQGVILKEEP